MKVFIVYEEGHLDDGSPMGLFFIKAIQGVYTKRQHAKSILGKLQTDNPNKSYEVMEEDVHIVSDMEVLEASRLYQAIGR